MLLCSLHGRSSRKWVPETAFRPRMSTPTLMEKPLKQHIIQLEVRVQQLTQDIMQNRKTRDERNRIEAELRVAQQALSHYREAMKLETKLQRN